MADTGHDRVEGRWRWGVGDANWQASKDDSHWGSSIVSGCPATPEECPRQGALFATPRELKADGVGLQPASRVAGCSLLQWRHWRGGWPRVLGSSSGNENGDGQRLIAS